MNISGKVVAVIIVVVGLAAAGLITQWNMFSIKPIVLTAQDMELLVGEVLPPQQQRQIADDPEKKKEFVKNLKQLLALAQRAESEGYADRPELKARLALQTDLALRAAYEKKHPGTQVGDEEVNAYFDSNPGVFDQFLESNPQFKSQAQGPQGEGLKKEFGQIKVLGERARREGLDKDNLTRLQLLLSRSEVLARAYVNDLQSIEEPVSDAEVDQYLSAHEGEFDQMRARHILISTREEDDHEDEEEGEGHAGLTREEAMKKAEGILARAQKGEDFAKLAEENSDDPGSKARGGDLDFFGRGSMTPAFEKAAFDLSPGQLSGLVETEYGFHIIKSEERRATDKNDPETRQRVLSKLREERLQKKIEEITASSKVEVAEEFTINVKPAGSVLPAASPDN